MLTEDKRNPSNHASDSMLLHFSSYHKSVLSNLVGLTPNFSNTQSNKHGLGTIRRIGGD